MMNAELEPSVFTSIMENIQQLREYLEHSVDERNAGSLSPIIDAQNVAFVCSLIDAMARGKDQDAAFNEFVDVFLEMIRFPKRF